MSEEKINNEIQERSSTVLKAGVWYTISNFLFKGMAFITTPIFVRMLTKGEYGDFSNFASWMSLLVIITSCDLQTSIIRSKLEFEDDIDRYISSLLALSTLITGIFYVIFLVFDDFIFSQILSVEKKYIHIMFLYLLAVPGYNMFVTKQRAFYKYKLFSLMTGVSVFLSLGFSLLLICSMDNKLSARIIGQYVPIAIMSLIIYILLMVKGKGVKISYCKYALIICIPLVPHLLAMNVLSTSDRIMIKRICGKEDVALYSIACSCVHIMGILLNSMNKAWAPWFLESLHKKEYKDIDKVTKPYLLCFVAISFMVLLLGPEIIFILGGKGYIEATVVLPPLIVGMVVQFIYTMYVQVEYYEKKTSIAAVGTLLAAGINIFLNVFLISRFGYEMAAYTTLIGYCCLLAFHYYFVCKLGYGKVFERKFIIKVIIGMFFAMFLFQLLYNYSIIRYIIIVMSVCVTISLGIKNKQRIIKLIKRKEKC